MISQPKSEEGKPVHKYIICDGCEMDPVFGIRKKCTICEELNLCENCELRYEHEHPFLKIKNACSGKFYEKNEQVGKKAPKKVEEKKKVESCPFSKITNKIERKIRKAKKFFTHFAENLS